MNDTGTPPGGQVFFPTAAALLALGLSPVLLDGKKPVFDNFTNYRAGAAHQSEMEGKSDILRYDAGLLELWQTTYPHANVGMLTRERPSLDVDDVTVWEIIKDLVPATPHCKQGQRGFTLIYSHDPADPVQRSRTYPNRFTKQMAMEVLAEGRQTVLPPSIHPDTGAPYVWIATPWGPATPLSAKVPPTLSQAQVDAIEARLREHGIIGQKRERGVALARELREDERHRYAVYLQPKVAERLEIVRTAAEGSRQEALNGAVFALARWVREGFIDADWLEAQMRAACGADGNRYITSDGDKAFTRQFEKAMDDGWNGELPDLDAGRVNSMGAAPLGFGSAPEASGGMFGMPGTIDPNTIPMDAFSLSAALDEPEVPLEWTVPGWIPHAQVSLVYGDGGAGKTTLLQMLAIAASRGEKWLGMDVSKRRVLFVTGEDEKKALVSQARAIAKWMGKPETLHMISLAEDKHEVHPFIVVGDKTGISQPTAMFWRIVKFVKDNSIDMLILDPVASIFAGNQNDPLAVYSFVNLLRRYIAFECNCTVIIAAHPSQDGMKTGKGTSGTVAWNNAVRARLYLRKGDDKADKTFRVLELPKANRGDDGLEINLRWTTGFFVHGAQPDAATERDASEAFMTILGKIVASGRSVSPNRSVSFAPSVFARHPDAGGLTKMDFETAMERLMEAGQIEVVETGPASKRSKVIMPKLS
jgi:archaellum biogenesis ATPase FlaH